MTKYIDKNKNELQKGFYSPPLWYFTGNYNQKGKPIFEDDYGRELSFDKDMARSVVRLNKENIKKVIEEEKQRVAWLEKKLKEIDSSTENNQEIPEIYL